MDEKHGGAAKLVDWETRQVCGDPDRPPELATLTGLAISGGGIRSASFALGIMQAFAEKERLHWFDYLSSVSGGGYISSALTWMRHKAWGKPQVWKDEEWKPGECADPACEEVRFNCKPPCFPFTSPAGKTPKGTMGRIHNALLRHMRQNGKYLIPGHGLNVGSLLAVVLRGMLVSLFVYLPILILAMLLVHVYVVSESPFSRGNLGPAIVVILVTGVLATLITLIAWWRRSALLSPERQERLKHFWGGIRRHVAKPTLQVTGLGAFSLLLLKVARVEEFDHLFQFTLSLVATGILISLLYAAVSSLARNMDDRWYTYRRWFEIWMGALLGVIVMVLLFASLPYVDDLARHLGVDSEVAQSPGMWGTVSAILGALFSGSAYLESARAKVRKLPLAIQVWLGAGLLIYGLMLLAYALSDMVYTNIRDIFVLIDEAKSLTAVTWTNYPALGYYLASLLAALLLGRYVQVNYLSVHRYYRDRLMETFMPELQRVLDGSDRESPVANKARLSAMCGGNQGKVTRPYHLVNTNVMLVNSKVPKFKARGGDNFILSPRFCGSQATGWRRTEDFMEDNMTLATSMAISGAAANPNTGVGGEGVTRNPALSFLMSLLNIRLGFWAPNPRFDGDAGYPDLLEPGLGELLRYGLDENGRYVQLSDGGHFENLGVYELIRRQAGVIVCSDAGADLDFNFCDLGNLVEKARVDFGAIITFGDDPKDGVGEQGCLEYTNCDNILNIVVAPKDGVAKQGYLEGTIIYRGGTRGRFIYIKSTWLANLPPDLVAYKRAHPNFPDESTADQFFGERQFEAYRELGYLTAWRMLEDLKGHLFTPLSPLSVDRDDQGGAKENCV